LSDIDSNAADRLVVIDEKGVARPVGESAQSEMSGLQGATLEILPSPENVMLMRDENSGRHDQAWLAGELASASPLHDVIAMIGQARWQGELVVCSDEAMRTILINDGNVVGAWSTAPSERLGEVLVHFGVLTPDQVEETSRAVGGGLRFGDAAVQLGFIDRETLFRHLHHQCEMIVYTAVSVSPGTFSFAEGYDETSINFPLSMPLNGMLMEGVRRMDEMQVYRGHIPSDDHVPTRVEGRSISPDDEALAVFLAIDGVSSVAKISHVVEKSVFDVTRSLHALVRKGAVAVHSPQTSGPGGVIDTFNEVITLILSEVDKYQGASQDIRDSLASFAASGVVYEPIFRGAGPAGDGSLDSAVVTENVLAMTDVPDRERALAELLYEYASFAMFISEPVLRAGAQSDAAAISSRVASLLAPLAPDV
jgi:hypothetical protein